jgi:nucleoside-diphosphate-sugar epimerase
MPPRVALTGGAGFIGGAVARALAARGDDVIALVRDPARPGRLTEIGVTLVQDDLSDVGRLTQAIDGADTVIHSAGSYRVGVPAGERDAMWDANVGTTTRVLDAAAAAGVPRIVYVSTVNVFGNTRGKVVDESYRRDLADGFLSWYDETKYSAHEMAEARIAAGAPIRVVMPSQVYGPRDHSTFGEQLALAHAGKLPYRALDDVGAGLVHVDDLADGIVAAMDRGVVGRAYVLSGPRTTLHDAIALAARLGGRKPPAFRLPTRLLRLMAPVGGLIGQPNLREVIASSAGVTYWATADRAKAELGWQAREIEAGFRDMFATA